MAEISLEWEVEGRLRQFWSKRRVVGELRAGGIPEPEATEVVGDVWVKVRDDLARETLRQLARSLVFLTMCAFMTYLLAGNLVSNAGVTIVFAFLAVFGLLALAFIVTALVYMARLIATRL